MANHPHLQLNCGGCSSKWPSRNHTRVPLLVATIQLMSGHGAQPRSNQGWILWQEESWEPRGKNLEAQKRTNKLNSHIMSGPGIEPGTSGGR